MIIFAPRRPILIKFYPAAAVSVLGTVVSRASGDLPDLRLGLSRNSFRVLRPHWIKQPPTNLTPVRAMSRFVSGGTNEQPLERDDGWLKAQKEIEEARRRKEEEGRQADGKSLYEVLQANKAAKQEAFEEANRLKNQFRSLDEDEVEFLDSVLESTRAKEAAIRKETIEQLDLFRKQQEEAEKATLAEQSIGDPLGEEEQWVISERKRKKGKNKEAPRRVKLRKSSTSEQALPTSKPALSPEVPPPERAKPTAMHVKPVETAKAVTSPTKVIPEQNQQAKAQSPAKELPSVSPQPQHPKPLALGLANYSSDEDD